MQHAIQHGARPFNIMSISIILIGVTFLALYQFALMPYLQKKGLQEKKHKTQIINKENSEKQDREFKAGSLKTE